MVNLLTSPKAIITMPETPDVIGFLETFFAETGAIYVLGDINLTVVLHNLDFEHDLSIRLARAGYTSYEKIYYDQHRQTVNIEEQGANYYV